MAHGALVRLLHAMCELVVLVVALLVESLAAIFARVRFVAGVYSRVRVQRGAPVERLAADGARVRLFLGVYDLVPAQRGRLPEAFAAHLRSRRKIRVIRPSAVGVVRPVPFLYHPPPYERACH